MTEHERYAQALRRELETWTAATRAGQDIASLRHWLDAVDQTDEALESIDSRMPGQDPAKMPPR
ncbi:MAG: hypothetical protein EOO24_06625 [Comamonadaceae bacterium]|nr:MAG: hypothetical protein EOO24_06625 [Comamonadaceae bacterium]